MLKKTLFLLPRLGKSPLFVCGITALICLSLSAFLLEHQHHQRLDIRSADYGQALANFAAKQATDATFNHDLVSLQVTVSDVARNPDILNATIHDVENQLLVQSGASPSRGDYQNRDHRSYSAPIALHDSVAGYVSVTVDHQSLYDNNNLHWLLALLALAGALVISAVIKIRHTADDPMGDSAPATAPLRDKSPEPISATQTQVGLSLVCLNADTLKQQLNGTMRQQLFAQLETQIDGMGPLYGAKLMYVCEEGLELQFVGDDLGNTSFRALCAAELLANLLPSRQSGVVFEFSGAVYLWDKNLGFQGQLQRARYRRKLWQLLSEQPSGCLLLDGQQCATSQTLQRLQTSGQLLQERWFVVDGLQPSYQSLLEKQAQQLQSMSSL